PPAVADGAQDVAEMLEAVAHAASLAGGGFQQDPHPCLFGEVECFIEGGGDCGDAGRFPFAAVGSRVEDEVADAERVAAEDLISESFDGLAAEIEGRGCQVDQVGRVRDDVRKPRAAGSAAELPGLGFLDRLADPAVVVLGEDLDDPAPRVEAPLDGARRPTRDGLVRSDQEIGGRDRIPWHEAILPGPPEAAGARPALTKA